MWGFFEFRGVAVGVLVVATVLEKAPHGPDVAAKVSAKLYSMPSALPGECVSQSGGRVPGVHGCGGEGVSDPGIPLGGEQGGTPRARPAESDTLNSKLGHYVIHSIVLRSPVHRETRKRERDRVQLAARERVVPGGHRLLRQIVEVRTKAGEIFRSRCHSAARRKTAFGAYRVASENSVIVLKNVVDADGALILTVRFIADVEVVIGIYSRTHRHVGHWQILHQKSFKLRVDSTDRNLVVGKLTARVGIIVRPGGLGGIVVRVRNGGGRVVNLCIALAEVALNFVHGRDR